MNINDLFKLAIVVLGIAGIGLFADVNFWERDGQLLTAQIPVTKWQRSLYRYKLKDVKKVIWAGHSFERAILDTNEYRTSGNRSIKFTESGFYAPSYALPRSKISVDSIFQNLLFISRTRTAMLRDCASWVQSIMPKAPTRRNLNSADLPLKTRAPK